MNYTARKRSTDIVVSVVAIALGLVLIFPVIYCVLGAFKTPAEFLSPRLMPSSFAYTQNFKDAMHQAPMLRYMLNSLIMATLGTVVRLVFSICAAFALTHYEFRGKNFCFFLILGTMMMPGDTLLITNYVTVSRLGLLNTYLGMCITGFVSASQMFMLRQKFLSVPKDLRYAAHDPRRRRHQRYHHGIRRTQQYGIQQAQGHQPAGGQPERCSGPCVQPVLPPRLQH